MPTLALPTATEFKLPNGFTVLYAQRTGVPVVAALLVVRTGSDANPASAPGLANFTAAMLDEGTASRTAPEIADAVAQLGATLTTGSTMDSSSVTTRALAKNFPAALDLLADVALHPSFPAAEIDRQRASRLASLVQQREDPELIAQRALVSALFGSSHPYGFIEIGTADSNKAITRDQLQAFWKQNFVPNNAALIVVGDITEADLRGLATREFGAWQPGTPVTPSIGAPVTDPARLIVVDKAGAPQTQLWLGAVGADRRTPDYAAIQVMNNAFGGTFSSRLNLNLREDKGYTYGAFSTFVMRKSSGPFFALAGVRTDVTGPALGEMLKEAAGMSTKPLTDDELHLAKDNLVRSLPGDFETDQSTAGSFSTLYVYGLGLDYWAKYPALINAIDGSIVRTTAAKYLAADRLHVVAVGDKAKIVPQLQKLDAAFGSPEIRDADGNVLK
jgi:zinc protease